MDEVRRVEPLGTDWQRFSWSSGTFDTARRSPTREVAGVIAIPHHLILVTLSGGARHLEVQADCGHRYAGEDFAGAVSFVPAGCARQLAMQDVHAAWASLSLRPDLLALTGARDVPTFTNLRDPLIAGVLGELARLSRAGELAPDYCDAMTHAIAHHLARRYGAVAEHQPRRAAAQRLPAWRLRKVVDYIEAHLQRVITVQELADVAGLSVAHFHRSLRATTGQTPLGLMHERRVARARQRLALGASISALSGEVGFVSPSHFARVFRRLTGVSPAAFRDGQRKRGE